MGPGEESSQEKKNIWQETKQLHSVNIVNKEQKKANKMAASNMTHLPQLTDDNFSNWKFRVQIILEERGVREVLNQNYEELSEEERKIYKICDAKAKSILIQCITDRHIEYVKDAKTAKEMICSLKNIFERKSTFSRLYIRRKLLSLKCKDEDLQEHFVKFDTLIREIESTGTEMEET